MGEIQLCEAVDTAQTYVKRSTEMEDSNGETTEENRLHTLEETSKGGKVK